ncbi:MAG TPA: chemotaxis protein CheA [Acidimicrobiales bacterium]|nr:chemotaxis protein CheA [Acidimicrobiales bacterium]
MSEIDEVVEEFLVESHENLDQLDRDLLALEEEATADTLAGIFRTLHTIKGTCGFLGFEHLEHVAHAGENLLSRLRDGELEVSDEITTALLATVDAIRAMLSTIEATGADGEDSHGPLVELLGQLRDGTPIDPDSRIGEILVDREAVDEIHVELALEEQRAGDRRPLGEILADQAGVDTTEIDSALKGQQEARHGVADSTIRVDVGLLDDLMNLVGELVLARNQIVQVSGSHDALTAPAQRLNLITTELQEGVMRTRMQPIGTVWNRFPRIVRDLAHSMGKQVRVELEGAGTELDKTVVEAIKDPLTHLVRNAVDHGIETPEVRLAAGKPAEGTLSLRAFHGGGQVNIEITDDGGGIDVERVKATAVAKGVITPERAAAMEDREALDLIFAAGFSTAAEVTNVSGRGVGMDVVRTNIERIGGALDLQSEQGQGTTVRIKIPLTLAIIPALVVGSADERFAIPQVSLLELVRLDRDRDGGGVEWISGAPVLRLRERLVPVVDLAKELSVGEDVLAERGVVSLVVLQAGDKRFAMVVDEIFDTQEIVVKPIGVALNDVGLFAGATIMGDGRVALILDVPGLAQRAGVTTEALAGATAEDLLVDNILGAETATLLVVDLGDGHRAALELSTITRLEQLPAESIEVSSRGAVAQYRGALLPLRSLAEASGVGMPRSLRTQPGDAALDVVVHHGPDGATGFVVDRIVDIVDEVVGDSETSVVVVAGKATDLIDVGRLLGNDPYTFAGV